MGSHPINLGLRFVLELTALVAFAQWGWMAFGGGFQWAAVIAASVAGAAAWGTFNVAGDPSRSGKAPIPVPGVVRLSIELVFFALAAVALGFVGANLVGWVFIAIVAGHYAASWDRVAWLLRR
jgi:hypothetical protein